jgi:hypothetical protein
MSDHFHMACGKQLNVKIVHNPFHIQINIQNKTSNIIPILFRVSIKTEEKKYSVLVELVNIYVCIMDLIVKEYEAKVIF